MNSLLKDRVRTAQGQSKDCGHLLNLAEEKVVSQEKLIASLEEVNDNRQKEKQDKITSNQSLIEQSASDKEKYQEELDNLEGETW